MFGAEKPLSQNHILVVEDDPEISELLAGYLRSTAFDVTVCASAEDATTILAHGSVDVVLLDVMLPGEDGFSLCRRLRASAAGPRIIMLTALGEPADKVIGLGLGADDYVGKPFNLRELLARIRAVLRRGPIIDGMLQSAGTDLVLRFAGFEFYPQRRFLRSPAGLRIPLTGAEADLLLVFCQHACQVLTREQLISLMRGEGVAMAPRSVDLLVTRLRCKLAPDDPRADFIRTIQTDGYAFQPEITIQ